MINARTFDEVSETVRRVQSQMEDINSMPYEHQELVSHIATISAKVVLEMLDRQPTSIQPIEEDNSSFPIVFGEWAQDYIIKTHFDRFLAIMLWLREKEHKNEVTTGDITYMYDKARWKKPANLADVFAKGAEKLYFTESETESDDGLKQWRMTRTGYQYIIEKEIEV